MKLAFIGTHLGSKQKYGTVQTFADIIKIHYGATVVAQPIGGDAQEENILDSFKDIKDIDIAIICHADKSRATNPSAFDDAVKRIDSYLFESKIKAIHLIFERDVPAGWTFTSGAVNFEIPKFNVSSKYRTQANSKESDNCIGIPGNLLASEQLIKLIDELL